MGELAKSFGDLCSDGLRGIPRLAPLLDVIAASQDAPDDVVVNGLTAHDASMLRELAENAGAKIGSGVVVLGLASDGKASLVAFVSEDLQKRLHAGKIIKKVAEVVGGSGGGRPDFAQAGGKESEKLDLALQAVYNIVAEFLS